MKTMERHDNAIVYEGDDSTFHTSPNLDNGINSLTNQNDHPEFLLQSNDICCSVLTTVVDFCMMIPTNLFEPEEYEENQMMRSTDASIALESDQSTLLVPVMRIFGPIIRRQRRDDSSVDSAINCSKLDRRPYQSACLYIHGAYPYMLARPTLAGLDGSATNDCPWDSPIKVQQMTPTIQDLLEKLVQETNMNFINNSKDSKTHGEVEDGNGPKANNENNQKATITSIKQRRMIRQITVVMGRGFYGYCSGPTAPFLRIEYYNPKDRWKIKRCLESGISIDSMEFFIPKQRYQTESQREYSSNKPYGNHLDEVHNLLKFHCFEAHIPYTMQFFKDYNLAGMTYLHVSEPTSIKGKSEDGSKDNAVEYYENGPIQFRQPLPSSIRASILGNPSTASKLDIDALSTNRFQPWIFLDSNTPLEYKWEHWAKSNVDAESLSISKKVTSCDVELDIHVSNICNQFDVMTSLPSQSEERQRTHWRAVPSLQEIWNQERQRMASLLPPHEDFLSVSRDDTPSSGIKERPTQDSHKKNNKSVQVKISPPFTLNVKAEDVVLPGAELAREGMAKLIQVTHGLQESFQRVLHQIVHRHARSIHQTDAAVLHNQKQQILKESDHENLTPSYDETIEALHALENLFAASSPNDFDLNDSSIRIKVPEESFNMLNDNDNKEFMGQESFPSSLDSILICKKNLLSNLSQTSSSSTAKAVNNPSLLDEYVMSQRVERGDGIVGHHIDNIDDVIDPETLTPYEIFEDEDDDEVFDETDDNTPENKNDATDEQRVTELLATLNAQVDQENQNLDDISIDSLELMKTHGFAEGETNTESYLVDATPKTSQHYTVAEKIEYDLNVGKLSHDLMNAEDKSCSPTPHDSNIFKEPNELPPNSVDGIGSPLVSSFRPLKHNVEYMASETVAQSKGKVTQIAVNSGIYIASETCAPIRMDVQSWCRKRLNLAELKSHNVNKRAKTYLRDDRTSCNKLLVEHAQNPVDSPDNVEDVPWKLSQDSSCADTSQDSSSLVKKNNGKSEYKTSSPKNINVKEPTVFGTKEESNRNQYESCFVEKGGDLKAKAGHSQRSNEVSPLLNDSLQCPVTIMSIEIFVQCRTGRAGINDSTTIAMTPDSLRDKISAILYVLSEDPGGGNPLKFQERGCIFVPVSRETERVHSSGCKSLDSFVSSVRKSLPIKTLGISTPTSVECVKDERQLLLRLASIVRMKDPDMLISWDTQASGLGYIIERGSVLGKESSKSPETSRGIDMARLLGRTPTKSKNDDLHRLYQPFEFEDAVNIEIPDIKHSASTMLKEASASINRWDGSGLGTEWDERVGAGAAAASVCGRLVFSAWKIIADEVKHPNCKYLQAVVSTVLDQRIPFHDNLKLSEWYGNDYGRERWRVLHYMLAQAVACLKLFDSLDIIGRSGEAARLSGVEFSQSFPGIRGSQYKVEGVLLRSLQSLNSEERGSKYGRRRLSQSSNGGLTDGSKSQTQSPWKSRRRRKVYSQDSPQGSAIHDLSDRCYFFFSPSLSDTTRQEALEAQALTLEPLSGHHLDPVVVCDFTALYPSLVIAYNLCYSTIAGRLEYHSTRKEMRLEGKTTGKVGPIRYAEEATATVLCHHVKSLFEEKSRDRAYVSPTGAIYVSETVVKGVLPQVLDEILSTRAMLKKAAKQYKKHVPNLSPSILRQLEARQLALKYVANVTYGYTSATFSGRCAMPLLADTIVECGRRTLTNAMNLANQWGNDISSKWSGIKVLYGDTDSLFIVVPGRSVNDAFTFGEEFCKAVTDNNPPPVQLKLEKVYLGSMMQTKKKYCGMKFESKGERVPTFEAKGLETVRRDQCLLTKKILRDCLVMLYRSGIDSVKSYLYRQWYLILSGRFPISDFILTGRVRSRYRGGKIGPVQAALARRLAEADPAKVVLHKERQAYVIVATPGTAFKLRDCVLTPMELLEQWDAYTIHTGYYITKHVNAALQRCLGLPPYQINVSNWFDTCPKPRQRIHFWPSTSTRQSNVMISTFFGSDKCSVCGRKCKANSRFKASVCYVCRSDLMHSTISSMHRLKNAQKDALTLAQQCKICNLCFEDASTFAAVRSVRYKQNPVTFRKNTSSSYLVTPLANCTCIDCPITFERHRVREKELEALAVCDALDDNGLST